MKTAKEMLIDGKTFTSITCCDCGNETSVKGRCTATTAKAAVERKCRTCNPVTRQGGTNWWSQFGLKKNPYVYGPMPRLRTSVRWRLEEARRMGWLAWYWMDEYTEERLKRSTITYSNQCTTIHNHYYHNSANTSFNSHVEHQPLRKRIS